MEENSFEENWLFCHVLKEFTTEQDRYLHGKMDEYFKSKS